MANLVKVLANLKNRKVKKTPGFTIVELLIVIVVIFILAAIAVVSYGGIQDKAEEARLKTDLKEAINLAERECVRNSACATDANTINDNQGFQPDEGVMIQYTGSDSSFCITASSTRRAVNSFYYNRDGSIQEGLCPGHEAPEIETPITSGWLAVSSGDAYSCGISHDNKVHCWEYVGNTSTAGSMEPVAIDTSGALKNKEIKTISAGDYLISCAIASDNQAYCWGEGQSPAIISNTGVLANKTIKSISVGRGVCAIASDNQAYCWGNDNSPFAISNTGALVNKTIKSISVGGSNICVIASDNQAYCMGSNNLGQLGNGSAVDYSSTLVAVSTSGALKNKTIKSISVGGSLPEKGHVCVAASDNNAYCWGDNEFKQLGDGSTVGYSSTPVAVSTSGALKNKTIKSISVGGRHTCVIASDNKTYCWGDNRNRQIDNRSDDVFLTPTAVNTTDVLDNKNPTSVSAGGVGTCALTPDNHIYCWGNKPA